MIEYLVKTVSNFPEKIAVRSKDTEYSFIQLLKLGFCVSKEIPQTEGGKPVLLMLEKSPEMVGALIGSLISKNLYCPVDVKSPIPRMQSIVSNLEPISIITSRKIWNVFSEIDIGIATILFIEDFTSPLNPNLELGSIIQELNSSVTSSIDLDPAYVIYTSGSTGTPKGVTISHRSIIDYIDWALETFVVDETDVIASQAPFYFDNSTLDIYLCLATGAELVIIPEVSFAFPAKLISELIESEITFLFWVPSVLVNVSNRKSLDGISIPSLRTVLFAGEVMPSKQLKYWFDNLPKVTFANLYGPTEITVDCSYYIITPQSFDYESIPIGTACRNSQLFIIDEKGKESFEGELYVRGAGLSLGYWGQFEQTQKAFVQNPFNDKFIDLFYKTGDLVFRNSEGLFFYKGRVDQQIKHRGYRIELGEIEVAVTKIEQIGQACAVYNDKESQIHLFVTLQSQINEVEMRKELAVRLPSYMIPSKIEIRTDLPLSQNGKIDRKLLKSISVGDIHE